MLIHEREIWTIKLNIKLLENDYKNFKNLILKDKFLINFIKDNFEKNLEKENIIKHLIFIFIHSNVV